MGNWDDPVARPEAIAAAIWSDIQHNDLDDSSRRYCTAVEEKQSGLLQGIKQLMECKRQAGVINAYRIVCRYVGSIRN